VDASDPPPTAWVIPPGQEACIREMLDVAGSEWELLRISVGARAIDARYRGPGGAEARLLLTHPDAGGPALWHTQRFRVDATWTGAADELATLRRAIEPRVRAGEREFVWQRPELRGPRVSGGDPEGEGHWDIEVLGVLAGAKPALRRAVVPQHAGRLMERLRAHGLGAARLGAPARVGGRMREVVYAARDAREAERLRDLEREDLAIGPWRARRAREIGKCLGYPDCCIDAFVRRQPLWTLPVPPLPRAADRWVAACGAWVPRPHWQLNDLLCGEGPSLIGFQPCRYDCAAATALAEVLAGALVRVDPGARERLRERLSHAVAIDRHGALAQVELDPGRRLVRGARPVPAEVGAGPDAASRRLAERVVRCRIGPGGRGGRWPLGRVLVVDFADRAAQRTG
jgi:hypothetical protein